MHFTPYIAAAIIAYASANSVVHPANDAPLALRSLAQDLAKAMAHHGGEEIMSRSLIGDLEKKLFDPPVENIHSRSPEVLSRDAREGESEWMSTHPGQPVEPSQLRYGINIARDAAKSAGHHRQKQQQWQMAGPPPGSLDTRAEAGKALPPKGGKNPAKPPPKVARDADELVARKVVEMLRSHLAPAPTATSIVARNAAPADLSHYNAPPACARGEEGCQGAYEGEHLRGIFEREAEAEALRLPSMITMCGRDEEGCQGAWDPYKYLHPATTLRRVVREAEPALDADKIVAMNCARDSVIPCPNVEQEHELPKFDFATKVARHAPPTQAAQNPDLITMFGETQTMSMMPTTVGTGGHPMPTALRDILAGL